jgi:hypothetical protein
LNFTTIISHSVLASAVHLRGFSFIFLLKNIRNELKKKIANQLARYQVAWPSSPARPAGKKQRA